MITEELPLSIVIVNYNGKRFLADCLDSIAAQVSCACEVIVVDNASIDGSCEFLREHYPAIQLLESAVNTGFTGGNNLGARNARGRILLLLNNDTKLLADIALLLREFSDPSLGALGCRLVYGDGKQQYSIGYDHTPLRLVLSWLGLSKLFGASKWFSRNQADDAVYRRAQREVSWVSGAFLMTPRAVWEKLGGLDEGYFMYLEDVDYCRRARDIGCRIAYTPEVDVIHYEGGGKAWIGGKALNNSMRSYLWYTAKFHGRMSVLFVRSVLAAVMFCRAAVYGLMSIMSAMTIWKEKRQAYLLASINLLKR